MAKKNTNAPLNADKRQEKEKTYIFLVTRIFVVLFLSVFPLAVGSYGYGNIVRAKAYFFWSSTVIFFILFAAFFLTYRLGLKTKANPREWLRSLSWFDWALVSYFLFITVSCILSPHRDTVFFGRPNRCDGWLTYFCLIAVYFIVSRCYNPKKIDFAIFAVGSVAVCAIGFLQFYGYDFLNLFPYDSPAYMSDGKRIFSGYSIIYRTTIGNIDFVSGYTCMALIAFTILFVMSAGKLKFLFLAASVINFGLMSMMDVDSGKVATLGALILLLPYWLTKREYIGRLLTLLSLWGGAYALHHWILRNKVFPSINENSPARDIHFKNIYRSLPLNAVLAAAAFSLAVGLALLLLKNLKWPKLKTCVITGIIMIIIIAGCGFAGIDVMGQRLPTDNMIHQAREILHGRLDDHFGSYRGLVWKEAYHTYFKHPFFGTGSDTFDLALGESVHERTRQITGVAYDKAHNDLIQILVCNGVFALLAYLAFAAGVILCSARKAFGDEILLMAAGVAVTYFIQSLFNIDSVVFTPIYWIMLGIARSRQLGSSPAP